MYKWGKLYGFILDFWFALVVSTDYPVSSDQRTCVWNVTQNATFWTGRKAATDRYVKVHQSNWMVFMHSLHFVGLHKKCTFETCDIHVYHYLSFSNLKGADQCSECAHFKDGPNCVARCTQGVPGVNNQLVWTYPDKNRQCQPCHANCTQG